MSRCLQDFDRFSTLGTEFCAGLSAGEVAEREENRKFRTQWDAIAWIQKHHPEVDLVSRTGRRLFKSGTNEDDDECQWYRHADNRSR